MPRPAISDGVKATIKAAEERKRARHDDAEWLRLLDQEEQIYADMREIERQAVDVLCAIEDADSDDCASLTRVCGLARLSGLRGRWLGLLGDLRVLRWLVGNDLAAKARGWSLNYGLPAVPWTFDRLSDPADDLAAEVDRLIATLGL